MNKEIEGKKRGAAVIVGINNYKDSKIPELEGAEYDANELYDRLSNPEIGNFEIKKEYFLTGTSADYYSIRKAISDVFYKPAKYDLALFYFSGHGFADAYGNGYIAPRDMIYDDPYVFGINMDELKRVIANSPNKTSTIMILDCCYSGIPTKGDRGDSEEMYRKSLDALKVEELQAEGRIVLASTEAKKVAKEYNFEHLDGSKHPHGAFTFYLLEALDGIGTNDAPMITLGNIISHIDNKENYGQKYKMSATTGTAINKIAIAKNPKKFAGYIDNLVKEAFDICEMRSIATLRDCASKVRDLESLDPQNSRIQEIKDRITASLSQYRGKIYTYLTDNENLLRPRIEQRNRNDPAAYTQFFRFEEYLSYDKLIKLDDRNLSLLSALCDVCEDRIPIQIFVERCSPKKILTGPDSREMQVVSWEETILKP
jgi:hypothetical protein